MSVIISKIGVIITHKMDVCKNQSSVPRSKKGIISPKNFSAINKHSSCIIS